MCFIYLVFIHKTGEEPPETHYSNKEQQVMLSFGEEYTALGKELTFCMEPYFSGRFETKYIPQCSHWGIRNNLNW